MPAVRIVRIVAAILFAAATATAVLLALQQGRMALGPPVDCDAPPCMGIGRPYVGWAWAAFLIGVAGAGLLWTIASTRSMRLRSRSTRGQPRDLPVTSGN